MLEVLMRGYIQPTIDRYIARIGPINPDIITAVSAMLGVLAACATAGLYGYTAVVLLWLSGACDMLDGAWARVFHMSSIRGMYADLIADRAVEGCIALSLAYAYPDLAWYTTLFLMGILLHFATFMLAAFMFPNTGEKSVHYEASIVERSEAFIGITVIILFPAYRIVLLATLSYIIIAVAGARFVRMYSQIY